MYADVTTVSDKGRHIDTQAEDISVIPSPLRFDATRLRTHCGTRSINSYPRRELRFAW